MLLLGGPAHGDERDLEFGQTELTIMAPSPESRYPTPWKYEVKEIEAETRPGIVFRRKVLVEQNMPVEVATQALTQVLLVKFGSELVRQFMEGGELVSGTDSADSNSESQSGLLIAKR